MMDSGNTPFVMNVEPSGCGNSGMNGWGGDWIWIILVFALIWGNGFGGFGGGNGVQGALTRGDLCMDMNFNDLQNAVRSGAAENNANFRSVDNAICTLGYQNAQLVNGVQMQIGNEFRGLDNNICRLGYDQAQLVNGLSRQISDCCCENRQAIAQVRYDNATNTRDIIESQNSNTRAILDYLCKDKIETLQSENQALRLAASQTAQNQYLVDQLRPCPQPSYIVCNPFTGQYGGYAYGNGCCGCNA